jgi:hypothetical protein
MVRIYNRFHHEGTETRRTIRRERSFTTEDFQRPETIDALFESSFLGNNASWESRSQKKSLGATPKPIANHEVLSGEERFAVLRAFVPSW